MSGWVHNEFLRDPEQNYEPLFAYPFDYETAKAAPIAEKGLVTQIFFEEVFADTAQNQNWLHYGLDFNVDVGTKVFAAANGTVVKAELIEDFGNTVVVQHDNGYYTVYGHLQSIDVQVGDSVSDENGLRQIGTSGGMTEHDMGSKKPHLHFAVRNAAYPGVWTESLNPAKYLDGYAATDAHECVKQLIVDEGIRDAEEIVTRCGSGFGGTGGDLIGGCAEFADVPTGYIYCPDIEFAVDNGWVNSPSAQNNSNFNLGEITRAEFLKIAMEAADFEIGGAGGTPYRTGYVTGKHFVMYDFNDISEVGLPVGTEFQLLQRDKDGHNLGEYDFLIKVTSTGQIGYLDDNAKSRNMYELKPSCFPDVDRHWAEPYVCIAEQKGYVSGNGLFRPDENIVFIEALKIAMEVFPIGTCWEEAGDEWFDKYLRAAYSTSIDVRPLSEVVKRGFGIHLLRQVFDKSEMLQRCYSTGEIYGGWFVGKYWKDDEIVYQLIKAEYLNNQNNIYYPWGEVPFPFRTLHTENGGNTISYEDPILVEFYWENGVRKRKDGTCKIGYTEFIANLNKDDYKPDYGLPCLPEDTVRFEEFENTYVLYTHGTKFYSHNRYGYFISVAEAIDKFDAANDREQVNGVDVGLEYRENFVFSPVLGTYIWYGADKDLIWDDNSVTAYYQPSAVSKGKIWIVSEDILYKLDSDLHDTAQERDSLRFNCDIYGGDACLEDRVVRYLGYPTADRKDATSFNYPSKTDPGGDYQDFIAGQIYHKTKGTGDHGAFYVPGLIAKSYTDDTGGSGQGHGWPIADPVYVEESNALIQEFNNGRIFLVAHKQEDGSVIHVVLHEYDWEWDPEAYWEGFEDQFIENEIYGLAASFAAITVGVGANKSKFLSAIVDNVIQRAGKSIALKNAARYIPLAGWGLTAISTAFIAYEVKDFHKACNPENKNEYAPHYYCGRRDAIMALGAIGFGIDSASTKILGKLSGLSDAARQSKKRLYNLIGENDDLRYKNFRKLIDKEDKILTNDFLEKAAKLDDISLKRILDLDEDSFTRLLSDKALRDRILGEGNIPFYQKAAVSKVTDSDIPNTRWVEKDYDPLPFPNNSNVVRLKIDEPTGLQDEFVRFHGDSNQVRPFILKRQDIPYDGTGKVDIQKLKDDFAIPKDNEITSASRYLPQKGDVLSEGAIEQGNPSLLQYVIEEPLSIDTNRFEIDSALSWLIP